MFENSMQMETDVVVSTWHVNNDWLTKTEKLSDNKTELFGVNVHASDNAEG